MKKLSLVLIMLCVGFKSESFKWERNKYVKLIEEGSDLTVVTGFKRNPDWRLRATNFDNLKVQANLPVRWDWRDIIPLRAARNQGSCGSCWAFSCAGVVELVWQLLHPDFFPPFLSAPQTLVDCSRYDCGGGNFDAFDYIKSKGLPLESAYPYTARNGSCKTYTPFTKITRWAYIGDGNSEPTIEQMKQAIYDHGPISVDVAANGSWSGYSSGIYDSCNSSSINHMIILTGWDDTDGKGFWYALNSWGDDWGEGGYMRTRYTRNGSNTKCNEIGETSAYAIVDGVENLREHLGLNTLRTSK